MLRADSGLWQNRLSSGGERTAGAVINMGTDFLGRIDALRKNFLAARQAIIIIGEENRRYFTGFSSSAGVLLVTQQDAALFADGRYIESARERVKCCAVLELAQGAPGITDWLKKHAAHTVFLEYGVRISELERYRQRLQDMELFPAKALENKITKLRRAKDTGGNKNPAPRAGGDRPGLYAYFGFYSRGCQRTGNRFGN
ncbi:MAG TPA: hypothetical protein DEQ02_09435 [Ruminococcaceae bacterium]|nr:hypothetical protein [Oscillospiraceae bacterium]